MSLSLALPVRKSRPSWTTGLEKPVPTLFFQSGLRESSGQEPELGKASLLMPSPAGPRHLYQDSAEEARGRHRKRARVSSFIVIAGLTGERWSSRGSSQDPAEV